MSDFSANLKELRKQANMSQDSLAEQLSVSRQTVSSWERGKSYPDLDMLVRICEMLHVTPTNCFILLKNGINIGYLKSLTLLSFRKLQLLLL